MFGISLILFGTLFLEVSSSIGKAEVKFKNENVYTFGFLSIFWSAIWFLAIIAVKHDFSFSARSLPTLILRIVLEIIMAELLVRGIIKSDRSAHSFIRVITIPLLLMVDLWLGYTLNFHQIVGMALILLTVAIVFYVRGVNKQGLGLVAGGAALAVITTSLYKYNITHFNSVAIEQFIVSLAILIYFSVMIKKIGSQHPLKLLVTRPFAFQSLTRGFGAVLNSFAFLFAPASIILAGERSLAILWAILSGSIYFQEKHFILKITIFICLSLGVYLLI